MRRPHRIALTFCALASLAAAFFATSAVDVAERARREVRVADVPGAIPMTGPASGLRRRPREAGPARSGASSWSSWSSVHSTGRGRRDGRGRPEALAAAESVRSDAGGTPRSAAAEAVYAPDIPPYFDPILVAPDTVSVGITGVDPLGPRRLALWRLSDGTASRLGETQSDQRQRFDFGQVLVPSSGLTLAVTQAGQPLWSSPASYHVELELSAE